MHISDLVRLLVKKTGWTQASIAEWCGVTRANFYERMKYWPKKERKDNMRQGVFALAIKNGLVAEAVSMIVSDNGFEGRDSSVVRAALMFPDLTIDEFGKITDAEIVAGSSPLPVGAIYKLIKDSRTQALQAA